MRLITIFLISIIYLNYDLVILLPQVKIDSLFLITKVKIITIYFIFLQIHLNFLSNTVYN